MSTKPKGRPIECSMTVDQMQVRVHELAVANGWWDAPRPFAEFVANLHDEVSEVWHAYAHGQDDKIPEELADLALRLLDWCEGTGIDLGTEIARKHEINRRREYRHGGKRA